MLGSSRLGGRQAPGRTHEDEAAHQEARRGPSHSPARGSGRQAGNYRIVYSSSESISDGEIHVAQRGGSVSAWHHKNGTAADGMATASAPASDSEESYSDDGAPLRSSVTIVLHNEGTERNGSSGSDGDVPDDQSARTATQGGASVAVSKQELQEMINWETNNLFDYLKGLYKQGEEGQVFDSEEWTRRMSALRQLLRERDGEVQQLQRLLESSQRQVEGQTAELEKQARRIEALEERIRQLMRQLEALKAADSGRGPLADAYSSGGELAAAHSLHKRQLAAAIQQPAYHHMSSDTCLVQLPAQSYAAYQGCGFWQSVVESVQHHPRRTAACVGGFLLLLLIVLCATLIPAAQHRHAKPRFLAAPVVAATGSNWVDLLVQLDRQAVVSYMMFRQADLNTQVAGTGHTLLELIQGENVEAPAVYAASAPATSLQSDNIPQLAGLEQLAVACGWAPATNSSGSSTVSILSAAASASSACSASGSASGSRCARCPTLGDTTAYTVLLVGASPMGRGISGVQVMNVVTGDAALNVNSVDAPYADNATAISFDLHFKLNTPGTLYYAVAYDQLFASYGASQLVYGSLTPPSSAIVAANPASFVAGLVANGSVAVAEAGSWVTVRVEPPCVAPLCQLSLHGLQGGTAYRVFLTSVDSYGVPDAVPAVVTITTAPATSAPALLPATAPTNITDSGFGMNVSMDAAGGVYYALVAPKPGADVAAADVAAGSWSRFDSLFAGGSSSRRLLEAAGYGLPASQSGFLQRRHALAAGSSAVAAGSLMTPTCYPSNRTCLITPASAFGSISNLASSFDTLASGCLPVPRAGSTVALTAFSSLQNDTTYYLLLSTEDTAVPQPNRLQPPAVYAVHTVDLSAPRLACGFPVATNITSSSFSLAAMLTKPGASVFYVVLPATAAATPPTAQEVLRGTGAGGAAAAAAGNLTRWGYLPWEVPPAADSPAGDARKMWAPVTGLQSGTNYTAFFAVTEDSSSPAWGSTAASLSGILTPNTVPPTFIRLRGLNASVDEQHGTFSVQMAADLDRAGQVYYALYRNYTCISGDPGVADIVAGNVLPPSICKCADASYCSLVTAGSFAVPAQTLGAVHSVGGELSALPFQALRNASDELLKCFQGGLGQATDTYNIYLVAGNTLPTYTGLAPQCSNFAQAAATAAAPAGGDVTISCPAAPQLACAQAQVRQDSQALQTGAVQSWQLNASSSDPLVWQPPAGVTVSQRPAKVQLSLEGGSAPSFTWGPVYPAALQTASSFGMQFALDKPALLIYAVFRPMPIDDSGQAQPPVLIATGRVPVFDAGTNASTGAVQACPWAPGGAMQPQSQYYITYVARDKYGRMDGLCPGQQPGSTPRVCTDLAFTGG